MATKRLRIYYTNDKGEKARCCAATHEQIKRSLRRPDLTFDEYRTHVYERSIPLDAEDVREEVEDVES